MQRQQEENQAMLCHDYDIYNAHEPPLETDFGDEANSPRPS